MDTKHVSSSKEIWILGIGLLNLALGALSLPSIEPTPEFYGALLIVVAVLRVWFTKTALHFKK